MKYIAFLMLIASLLGLSACTNPAGEEEVHAEVEGLIIRNGNDAVVTIVDGVATGQLTITEAETPVIYTIEFQDHAGLEVHAEDLEDGITMAVVGDDDTVATVVLSGAFGFELDGIASGTTEMEIQLLHNGHLDFRTPKISVVVSQ